MTLDPAVILKPYALSIGEVWTLRPESIVGGLSECLSILRKWEVEGGSHRMSHFHNAFVPG